MLLFYFVYHSKPFDSLLYSLCIPEWIASSVANQILAFVIEC